MNLQRAVAFFTILIVMLLVAAAFMVLGPPSRQRAEALDRRRVDNLRQIAQTIYDDYGALKQPVPARLDDPHRDPITRSPYEYRALDPSRYVLCASFELPSPPGTGVTAPSAWRHGAGRTCYYLDARHAPA